MKTIMLCLIVSLCLAGANDPVALAWDDDDDDECCSKGPSVLDNLTKMREASRERHGGKNALSNTLNSWTSRRRMQNAMNDAAKVLESGRRLDQLTVMQIARKNKLSLEQLSQLVSMVQATAELGVMHAPLPAEETYKLPPDVQEAINGMGTSPP